MIIGIFRRKWKEQSCLLFNHKSRIVFSLEIFEWLIIIADKED